MDYEIKENILVVELSRKSREVNFKIESALRIANNLYPIPESTAGLGFFSILYYVPLYYLLISGNVLDN